MGEEQLPLECRGRIGSMKWRSAGVATAEPAGVVVDDDAAFPGRLGAAGIVHAAVDVEIGGARWSESKASAQSSLTRSPLREGLDDEAIPGDISAGRDHAEALGLAERRGDALHEWREAQPVSASPGSPASKPGVSAQKAARLASRVLTLRRVAGAAPRSRR